MSSQDFTVSYSPRSAIYHLFEGKFLTRGRHVHRVYQVSEDGVGKDVVQNPAKLEARIAAIVSKESGEHVTGNQVSLCTPTGGTYEVWPRSFYCFHCKLVRTYFFKELHEVIGDSACPGCKEGRLIQTPHVFLCPRCGTIEEMAPRCPACRSAHVRLHRGSEVDIATWRYACAGCSHQWFFSQYCRTSGCVDPETKQASRMLPKTATGGGVVSPLAGTHVDLPVLSTAYEHAIVLATVLKEIEGDPTKIIQNARALEGPAGIHLVELLGLEAAKAKLGLAPYEAALKSIEATYGHDLAQTLAKVEDFVAVKCELTRAPGAREQVVRLDDLRKRLKSPAAYAALRNALDPLMEKLRLQDVTYVENVQLVDFLYGRIHGPTKAIGNQPVHRRYFREGEASYKAYVKGFRTEGLLFEVNPVALVDWLKDAGALPETPAGKPPEVGARYALLSMAEDSVEEAHVKTLLHSLSHAIIKSSTLHAGLDEGSFGEIVFPHAGGLLIYSTTSPSLGGLATLFESSLPSLLESLPEALASCAIDPVCKAGKDGAACFSCLHLPEYACRYLNEHLDRTALVPTGGTTHRPFWAPAQ